MNRRAALREALSVYGAVMLACAIVTAVAKVLPSISEYVYLGFPALFLAVPTWIVWRYDEEYEDYGLVAAPVRKGLAAYVAIAAVILPPFVGGFVLFYRLICAATQRGLPLPRFYAHVCTRFVGGWSAARLPQLNFDFAERIASQLVVVALPEEYFFRGFLQTRLEQAWQPKLRFLSGGIGLALVVTSLLFAVGHVITDFNPLRLAVFFPSLLFGWLRSATGSVLASVLFHASCNIAIDLLNRSFFTFG